MIDPYKVLGVSPGASQDEIKKAYRKRQRNTTPTCIRMIRKLPGR